MRIIHLAAVAALVSIGAAQSPLRTLTGGTNLGNVGGGIYFDLQVHTTVTFTQWEFYTGNTTVAGNGSLDIYIGPSTYVGNVANPALWTFVASVAAAVAPNQMASGPLSTPFALAPGNYGIVLKANGFSHGYSNGVPPCSSNTIPGTCTNSLFSNNELTLRAGASQNVFLSGAIFTPRIFNGALHYTLGGTPIRVAAWEDYGLGCYENYRSFYQIFANPVALNLGTTGGVVNPVTALRLVHLGGTYRVTSSTSPIVPPSSPAIALPSDDSTFLASASFPNNTLPFPIPHPLNGSLGLAMDLEIATDGYIVPSPATMPVDNTPSVNDFLSNAPRWCPHWKNMSPVTTGSMHVEHHVASQTILVTWNMVADNALATTSTFQVAFYPSGDVEYRYGAMSQNGGGTLPIIIGWTEGGGALDPGNIEIATSLPFETESIDNAPLQQSLSGRPVLGTSVNMVTDSIPAGTTLGAQIIGFVQNVPGVPLGSIGMPNCFLNASIDASVGFPVSGAVVSFPLPIPSMASLNGARVYAQSVTISSGFNTLGVITSNGVQMTLGSL